MGRAALPILLFLLSPAMSLVYALMHLRDLISRNLIWMFCCFYGMAFFMGTAGGADCERYRFWLEDLHGNAMSLETFSSAFYQEGQYYYDIYQPLVTFAVSRFTNDYRVLFAIFGLVIGFFYSRVIGFFIDECPNRLELIEYGLILMLAFVLNIGNAINGVRMYTALFVFVYGALYFWRSANPLYFLIAASSVLVHFSFLLPVAIFTGLTVLQRFPLLVYASFIFSFAFTAIEIEAVRGFVEQLPMGFESRVRGYLVGLDPDRAVPRVITVSLWMSKLFRIFAVSYLFLSFYPNDCRHLTMLMFAMLLNCAVNLLGEVSSIGRFLAISEIFILGQLLLHVNHIRTMNNRLTSAAIASFMILSTLLSFRLFSGFASMNLLLANPFTIWFFSDPQFSLYDYMPKFLSGL